MPTQAIPYSETRRFTPLILDYLEQKQSLKKFYGNFPDIPGFQKQVISKKKDFNPEIRKLLPEIILRQYSGLEIPDQTRKQIELLGKENTFTVTTGHQLNIFTGPLYFLYKIITTVKLARHLQENDPDNHYVPVYWMATEDHDFDEISFFNLHGKKFQWNPPLSPKTGGAVGDISTEGLENVFELFSAEIGNAPNAQKLKEMFRCSYLQHQKLSSATRALVNEMFKDHGLVIFDADEKDLKKFFIPQMEEELKFKKAYHSINATVQDLQDQNYIVQANPREINLFYLDEGFRGRILERDGKFFVEGAEHSWTEEALLKLLHKEPQKFSPNVLLRPLFQEVILPNLCYIGGGGELAYWLQLKQYFEDSNILFPILLLRNSVLLQTQKQNIKRQKLGISLEELFLEPHELINRKVRRISNIDINFSPQKEHLVQQFRGLYELAEKTDKSFLGAVKAQEVKQLKGLDHLEKRLLKAQKRKLQDHVARISSLQLELFPNQALQERQQNFSEFYLEYGDQLLEELFRELQPLKLKFDILSL